MFDSLLRPLIDQPLNAAGRCIASRGISANTVTVTGIVIGLGAAVAIAHSVFVAGLVLIVVNRVLDGLDGAVARATNLSDFGGYLDIVSDFIFYVAVPIGFGFNSTANQIPALLLVGSFALTGVSFLAFATLAAKRNLVSNAHGSKSFFYDTGVAEGAETIAVFLLMCLFPAYFAIIALIYAGLCLVTVLQRSGAAWKTFS